MTATDVSDTLTVALRSSGLERVRVRHRPRLLSDNGPSYLSAELSSWLAEHGMTHTRGKPYHPMTQDKIERYHRSMKNQILLENYYLPGQLEARLAEFAASTTRDTTMKVFATYSRRCLVRPGSSHSHAEGKHQVQDHRTATTTASPGDRLNVNPMGSTLSCFSAQFVQKLLTTYSCLKKVKQQNRISESRLKALRPSLSRPPPM